MTIRTEVLAALRAIEHAIEQAMSRACDAGMTALEVSREWHDELVRVRDVRDLVQMSATVSGLLFEDERPPVDVLEQAKDAALAYSADACAQLIVELPDSVAFAMTKLPSSVGILRAHLALAWIKGAAARCGV